MKRFFKTYVFSYDTIIGIVLSVLCIWFLPSWVSGSLIIGLLEMGIGVLSIIFSIFFAALAFIISASDDEFVGFLEEDGFFTRLINSFKWTVLSLFIALIYSIVIYTIASFGMAESERFEMSEYVLMIFCFLFFYSLIATLLSTNDAIRYSKTRVRYIQIKKENSRNDQEEN